MNNPKYILIDGKKIEINTDFRVALQCQDIAIDETINDVERAMAIIFLLFGEAALNDEKHYSEYLEQAFKFLGCGMKHEESNSNEEPIFDFRQDWGYIKASFMSDYQIDLDTEKIHWWTFNDYLKGLTKHSKLMEVMRIRSEPLSGKKGKEREEWIRAKESVALEHKKTQREKELDKRWEEMLRKKGE